MIALMLMTYNAIQIAIGQMKSVMVHKDVITSAKIVVSCFN